MQDTDPVAMKELYYTHQSPAMKTWGIDVAWNGRSELAMISETGQIMRQEIAFFCGRPSSARCI